MNSNVWNVKEMLSIPIGPGTAKMFPRDSAPSDYSSLTDSQFLFGSQFLPENLESQDFGSTSRMLKNSQQNSQPSETELKFVEKYQAKPYLFGAQSKAGSGPQFSAIKPKSILAQFQTIRKKVQDRDESDIFSNWISNLQHHMEGIKNLFNKFEEKTEVQSRTILERLESTTKTLQENINTQYESIVSALEAKSSSNQVLQMERRLEAKEMELSDLRAQLQLMQECLDGIKHSQCQHNQKTCEQLSWLEDHFQFTEILSELHKLRTTLRPIIQVQNNITQTSPSVNEEFYVIGKKKAYYESRRVCRASFQPQPAQTDSLHLHENIALLTEAIPNNNNIHVNIYQPSPGKMEPHASSIIENDTPAASSRSVSCSAGAQPNNSSVQCPGSASFSRCPHRELLPNELFSQGDVRLAQHQPGLMDRSPHTLNTFKQIRAISHYDKETKWAPVHYSVRYPFVQNLAVKDNDTGEGDANRYAKMKIRGHIKRKLYVTNRVIKDRQFGVPGKPKVAIGNATPNLDTLKSKTIRRKQTLMSKKVFTNTNACERQREPYESLCVRNRKSQNYSRHRGNEIHKAEKKKLSLCSAHPSQESCLQNEVAPKATFQSWFSPLTLTPVSCKQPPTPSLKMKSQNKTLTEIKLFDSSDDSD